MRSRRNRSRGAVVAGTLLALGLFTGAAGADTNSCREWRHEHFDWKVEALRRYLGEAPQRRLDEAMFELLQREAYLTSCRIPVAQAHRELVGWRLVGRPADGYGDAVVESLLEEAGFDLSLRGLFTGDLSPARPAELSSRSRF